MTVHLLFFFFACKRLSTLEEPFFFSPLLFFSPYFAKETCATVFAPQFVNIPIKKKGKYWKLLFFFLVTVYHRKLYNRVSSLLVLVVFFFFCLSQ